MQCERCGEGGAVKRSDEYVCGRCSLRIDWEGVVRSAQGLAVKQEIAGAAPASAAAATAPADAAPDLPPADPFAS